MSAAAAFVSTAALPSSPWHASGCQYAQSQARAAGTPAILTSPVRRSLDEAHSWRAAAVAVAATGAAVASQTRSRTSSSQRSRPQGGQRRPEGGQRRPARDVLEWGGIKVFGPCAEWLKAQMQQCKSSGMEFGPTDIQKQTMPLIYEGQNIAIQAPTGTGKTLAYLLPLLVRLELREEFSAERRHPLRLLILVPSADLQMQVTATIQMLVGEVRAQSVVMYRRDIEGCGKGARVLVATPRQMKELLDDKVEARFWKPAMESVETIVVDEADKLVARWTRRQKQWRWLQGKVDPCVEVLEIIRDLKMRLSDAKGWQLVACTASWNRQTDRRLRYSTGQELQLMRSAGEELPEWAAGHAKRGGHHGQYGEGTASWSGSLIHTARVIEPYLFPRVLACATQTIRDLDVDRTLVIIGDIAAVRGNRSQSGTFGLNPVTANLRFRLEESGYSVKRVSEEVEAAASVWAYGAKRDISKSAQRTGREVIVGNAEAIRGIHLEDIDAVIIIGDCKTVNGYMHCAGRTGRIRPGELIPRKGSVVSLITEASAIRLFNWGQLTGFKVLEVTPLQAHPSLEEQRLQSEEEEPIESAPTYEAKPPGAQSEWPEEDYDDEDDDDDEEYGGSARIDNSVQFDDDDDDEQYELDEDDEMFLNATGSSAPEATGHQPPQDEVPRSAMRDSPAEQPAAAQTAASDAAAARSLLLGTAPPASPPPAERAVSPAPAPVAASAAPIQDTASASPSSAQVPAPPAERPPVETEKSRGDVTASSSVAPRENTSAADASRGDAAQPVPAQHQDQKPDHDDDDDEEEDFASAGAWS
eukprot:TRINITY_DN19850_c0_g5_i1.p1 TRINITY_DN19850_c0_g5~~TRINITY_DN19850_c0_g5_i1.p1  ORF type:complete len:812 (-),score=187.43 TRINITY_DN19850_c0_g5_i1:64-2499(-)